MSKKSSDGGKGSAPRPYGVNHKTFSDNWDMIFGKKEKVKEQDERSKSTKEDSKLDQ